MVWRRSQRLVIMPIAARSGLLLLVLCVGLLRRPGAVRAHDPDGPMVSTASYQVMLMLGPAADILTETQATGLYSGEIMVPLPGSPVTVMNTSDQANPVNHHVEVFIYDRRSGAPVSAIVPAITFTDADSGAQHAVPNVVAMYDASEARSNAQGRSTLHFGNNLYLPDGMYTVTVQIGGETAHFAEMAVSMTTGATMTMPAVMLLATPYKAARAAGQFDAALANVAPNVVYDLLGVAGQGKPALRAQLQTAQQGSGVSISFGDAVESLDTVMYRMAVRSDAIHQAGVDRVWVVETLVVDQGAIVAVIDAYDVTDMQTMTFLQAQGMS